MKRLGKRTLEFRLPPTILSHGAVGGKKEAEGPLGGDFDQTFQDSKAGARPEEVDFILAGDLLNQCISSTFGLLDFRIPFLGQYGACSTMAQTLLVASILVESGAARRALAVTSSHFCSAERQFRLPLEYGGQRAPTAQWTATAAGCALVGLGGPVVIRRGLAGTIQDLGVKDAANMGAAMAPAAAESIFQFLEDTGTCPQDYDGIYTGDLGAVGSELLYQCLGDNGIDLRPVHQDCGLLLYDRERQDVHAGASGCGCSASVLCGHLLRRMERGELRRILFCATGALMSPTSSQQGLAIPGVCHVLELVSQQ